MSSFTGLGWCRRAPSASYSSRTSRPSKLSHLRGPRLPKDYHKENIQKMRKIEVDIHQRIEEEKNKPISKTESLIPCRGSMEDEEIPKRRWESGSIRNSQVMRFNRWAMERSTAAAWRICLRRGRHSSRWMRISETLFRWRPSRKECHKSSSRLLLLRLWPQSNLLHLSQEFTSKRRASSN